MNLKWVASLSLCAITSCQPSQDRDSAEPQDIKDIVNTFDYDLEFLQNHLDSLVLLKSDDGQAQLIIAPQYQGRVMSSTAEGEKGDSFGWINYELITSGEEKKHINPYGGEDRFWMGPEGGQFAIFFKQGEDLNFENWQTPAALDTEPFAVQSQSQHTVTFSKAFMLENHSGSRFQLEVKRKIRLLGKSDLEKLLGLSQLGDKIASVGFSSENTLINRGEHDWTKEKGLLSIWILGMFKPSPATTIVIPYKAAQDSAKVVNDSYFGKVPEDRLQIKNGIIYFKGDGKQRGKIGVPPQYAREVMGSYDAENKVLTIVKYTLPENTPDYVNSMWELQDDPYRGDAANAYNDGPLEDGEQMGPFYELESSSPAAALQAQDSIRHVHTTVHFTGERETLDQISREVFGVDIAQITAVF